MRPKLLPATLLEFIREANGLEAIPRGGFVISGVQNAESVQAHSHGVALTALGLAEMEGKPFDAGKLLLMALLHDLAEARTGDIVLRFQHYFPPGALKAAEKMASTEQLAGLPGSWRQTLDALHAGTSIESRCVHAADKLQMMIKVAAYEDQKRGDLEAFWSNPKNFRDGGLTSARACYQALARSRGRKLPKPAPAKKTKKAKKDSPRNTRKSAKKEKTF